MNTLCFSKKASGGAGRLDVFERYVIIIGVKWSFNIK